jgi:DNA replication and repair protein RecF
VSDFLGNLPVVLFAPEDLDIVRRDPEDRRSFLDTNMALLKPRLAQLKLDYDKALKQRNALLKSAKLVKNADLSTLDIWDEQIANLGSKLTLARLDLISQLSPLIQDFYNKLSTSQERITMRLVSLNSKEETEEISQKDLEQMLLTKLHSLRDQRGITLAGPHRDELLIEKNSLPVRTQASQGEAWSIALGLKLALAQLLRESSLGDPVVILDDVFSVLDPGRRARMLEFVVGFEQVLITAADLGLSPELELSATYSVMGGELIGD